MEKKTQMCLMGQIKLLYGIKLKCYLLMVFVLFSILGVAQNYSLLFDGVDDKVVIFDSPELNPATAFTIEAWIYPEAWAVNTWDGCIVCKQATNPDKGYCLAVGANGRVDFCHSIDETWTSVVTTSVLELNSWAHIAGVYDGNEFRLYINGVLQATASGEGTPTLGSGVDINLAENPTWPGRYFTGKLDEVRIWEVARTVDEIQSNLANELSGSEEGLVAYWNMNLGSGDIVMDISGNYNDGALINMQPSSWVEGFSLPSDDAGVIGIAAPTNIGNGFSEQEKIKIDVKNYSMTAITNFTICYKINNGEFIFREINDSLDAFSSKIYCFPGTVDLAGYSDVVITGKVILDEDCNPDNDEVTESVTKSNTYNLFNQEPHNSGGDGKVHLKTVYMPEDFSNYEKILLHIDLESPENGCDPNDQPAWVNILYKGVQLEIARYITPFGVACGGWTFDITDFKSLLKEKAIFESYIEVWGTSGWLVNMVLEFVPGTPEYQYVKLTPLWNEDKWVYGDPYISDDLPEMEVPIASETESVKLRMTVTGHGIGNTLNAAEYAEFTHKILINDTEELELHLWKDNCDQNTCSPQNANYQDSRAGWCPGQDVQPWDFNLDGMFVQGSNLKLDFVLADYSNYLHYNYNATTHREPCFKIHTYLVQYASNNFVGIDKGSVGMSEKPIVYPNPSSGIFTILSAECNIESINVYRIDGKAIYGFEAVNSQSYEVNLSNQPDGIYFFQLVTVNGIVVRKVSKNAN